MKKIIKQFILLFLLINLGLTMYMSVAYAAAPSVMSNPVMDQIQKIGGGTGMPNFVDTGQHPDAPPDYLQQGVGTATSPIYFALDMFRYVISGIAIIIVMIQAVKLVSTANDEEAEKSRMTLLMGIIGLMVIQLADVAVKKMFFGEMGEAFEDKITAELYAEESVAQLRGIIGFVQAFVAVVTVLVLVIRGFTVITSTGDEEEVGKAKKHILYALVGLAMVAVSELVVRYIIFPDAGKSLPSVDKGKFLIIEIVNFMSGFVAILAFIGLFIGGYNYVIAGASDEDGWDKVKKMILGSVIALVVSLGAYALVNTFLDIPPVQLEGQEEVNVE